MKKLFTIQLILLLTASFSLSQLPDGTIMPDFTATDINGNTVNLYSYLNAGKPVIVDISATWCEPCWNFHETHALRDLYNQYGPDGTNELMVLFIEGDGTTGMAELQGTGNTMGDWITGTPYPIIDDESIADLFQIGWFPTIYKICPDKSTTMLDQMSAAQFYAEATACPGLSVIADFTSDVTSVTMGGSVNFSDLSDGNPNTWSWNFTGGSPTSSTAQNPTVVYNTPGTYTVSLTATNFLSGNSDTETKTAYITVLNSGLPPVAEFGSSNTTVLPGGTVTYTDLSTGNPTSWSWTFTGGSPSSSSSQNPVITYNNIGTYQVVLTVTNAQGTDAETKSAYITVADADYCAATGGCEEHISNVQIGSINNSSACDGYSDYSSSSTLMQIGESNTITITNTDFWVGDINGCWVDWNYDGDFDDANETITINFNNSTGVGTGTITVPGNAHIGILRMRVRLQYEGVLTACGTTSYGEVEDYSIQVTSSGNMPTAAFTADQTNVSPGETVQFTDISSGGPTSWSWSFVGATPASSSLQNPSVVYNSYGTYQVSLTVTNGNGSDTEVKTSYITVSDASYCDAGSSSTSYEYISNVSCGNINNTSDSDGYADFTAQASEVAPATSFSLSITSTNSYSTDQVIVWIDWNQDADFDDSGEMVFTSAEGTGPYTSSVSVPIDAAAGSTRMRIRLHDTQYTPNTSPCGNSGYGEVEDYTINVTGQTLNDNALLNDLTVDGTTVAGFGSQNYSYSIVLPYGTTIVPTVGAITQDPNAGMLIADAASLPGTTTISVTAEDGVSQSTYDVEFTIGAPTSSFVILDTEGNDITGSEITVSGEIDDFEIISYVHITNTNASDISVKVSKVENSIVSGTENALCWGYCFLPSIMTSPYGITIAAGETNSTDFSGHYSPNGNAGLSSISYRFFDENNPSDRSTITVLYDATISGSSSVINAEMFDVYPNPTNGMININLGDLHSNVESVKLVSMVGQTLIETSNVSQLMHIDLSSFAEGIYFVNVVMENEVFTKRVILK